MTTSLDYKNDFLCVLAQYEVLHGQTQTTVKEWYPVRPADEAEVATLLGRPLTEVDSDEGIYVDEEGNVFSWPTRERPRRSRWSDLPWSRKRRVTVRSSFHPTRTNTGGDQSVGEASRKGCD